MISVVVPVYNTAKFLPDVIEALLGQNYPQDRYELIFIDNGSTDGSLEILRRQKRIKVLSEAEQGSYAARNRGVAEVAGEIVAFTDSDCQPVPGWLSAIEQGFGNPVSQVLSGPRLTPVDSTGVRLLSSYENSKARLMCTSDDPLLYYGYTNNMAVRRSILDRFGPFIQRARGSDTIFVRRVVDSLGCEAVTWCPDMAVRHAEMESVAGYFGKFHTYAHSHKAFNHITPVRTLSARERLAVFRIATRGLSVSDSIRLFALLLGGSIAWWLGGLGVARSDS